LHGAASLVLDTGDDSTTGVLVHRIAGRYDPDSREGRTDESSRLRHWSRSRARRANLREGAAAKRMPRIAFLTTTAPGSSPTTDAFREGLRELGYVEDQNISIEWRW
jgi:hypothetical protein